MSCRCEHQGTQKKDRAKNTFLPTKEKQNAARIEQRGECGTIVIDVDSWNWQDLQRKKLATRLDKANSAKRSNHQVYVD